MNITASSTSSVNTAQSLPAPVTPASSSTSLDVFAEDTFETPASTSNPEPAPASSTKLRRMKYSKLMGITRKWENEASPLKKFVQVPLVPLYVMLDLATAPLVPFANVYEFIHNQRVNVTNALNS